MEKLIPFLEQLALKLGTTVEKVWAILLRQAPIDGIIHIVICLGLVFTLVKFFKFVNGKTTIPPVTEKDRYPKAQWGEEGACFAWAGIVALLVIVIAVICCSIPNIVTAFLNPEYWALQKALSTFGK